MGEKSDELRAQARRLEESAETVCAETTRLALMSVARRYRDLAREVERYETDVPAPASERPASELASERPDSELKEQNRKATIAALTRAVRVYWEYEKAQPLPDFLAKLAAAADEACRTKPASPEPNADPEPSSPSCPQTPWKQTT